MTTLFAAIVVLHGIIHLMGFAKAFGRVDLSPLTQPISQAMGLVWLLGALLMLATAGALIAWPRWWWAVGALAAVVSQIAVTSAWTDAKFGTVANVIIIAGVVFGFLAWGPTSLRTQYEADVARGLARTSLSPSDVKTNAGPEGPARNGAGDVVTEADLAHLPDPVQRYLRMSGVIGQPRVRNMRARMHGRIRSGPDARWMPFRAEQYNFYDEPTRLFYMNASMMTLPIQGLHRFVGTEATMLVKAVALVPVAQASGPEMTQAETVTLFNDMCLFAPGTLIDPAIGWEAIDRLTARARFTHAGHTIAADLFFNDAHELINFRSDDRRRATADGSALHQVPWTTPMRVYRQFGAHRLGSQGEARWHELAGDYAYIELTIDDITFNVAHR